VYDDYGHHPTEVKATLEGAKALCKAACPHGRLVCVFQPHTYSRTLKLKKEFAEALSIADHVVLAKIYAAREEDPGTISSGEIRALLEEMGCDAYYFDTFEAIEKFLLKNCVHGDLLITMGAGNVVNIGEDLLK
jgi:UDP-N-acetylmuramate--alanine ligase